MSPLPFPLAHPCLRTYIEQLETRIRDLERLRTTDIADSAETISTFFQSEKLNPAVRASCPNASVEEQSSLTAGGAHYDKQLRPDQRRQGDANRDSQLSQLLESNQGPTTQSSMQQSQTTHHILNNPVPHVIESPTNVRETSNSSTSCHDDQSVSSDWFEQVRNILRTKDRGSVGQSHQGVVSPSTYHSWSEPKPSPYIEYHLPLRSSADQLLTLYWNEIHTFFPFVHKPSFQAQYDLLWERAASPCPRIFHCMLNTIFALAYQLNSKMPADARQIASGSYFGRAKQLLQHDLFEPQTLEDVQALLLMSQYLQNTKEPAKCWAVVGSAIRTAQGLRLHQTESVMLSSTQRDVEMFRRIWHGCLMMDR